MMFKSLEITYSYSSDIPQKGSSQSYYRGLFMKIAEETIRNRPVAHIPAGYTA